jgi:hypothetical protein
VGKENIGKENGLFAFFASFPVLPAQVEFFERMDSEDQL